MSETDTQTLILRALNRLPNCRIWRNNVGVDTSHGVRYGLLPGSGDLIGLACGVFLSIECKSSTGKSSQKQVWWAETIERMGGIAGVARSVDDAMVLYEKAVNRAKSSGIVAGNTAIENPKRKVPVPIARRGKPSNRRQR